MNAEEILIDILSDEDEAYDKEDATNLVQRFKDRVQKECDQLDGKFAGLVWRRRGGKVEEQFVSFMPRDNLFPGVLNAYADLCLGSNEVDTHQYDAVLRLSERVVEWREGNADKCKYPDVEPGELET